jgi:hypothetical protein
MITFAGPLQLCAETTARLEEADHARSSRPSLGRFLRRRMNAWIALKRCEMLGSRGMTP